MIQHHTVSKSRKNRLNNWTIFLVERKQKKEREKTEFDRDCRARAWRMLLILLNNVKEKKVELENKRKPTTGRKFLSLSLKNKKPNSKVGCWSVYQRKQPTQNLL